MYQKQCMPVGQKFYLALIAIFFLCLLTFGCAYLQAPPHYNDVESARKGSPNLGRLSQPDYIQIESFNTNMRDRQRAYDFGYDREELETSENKINNGLVKTIISSDVTYKVYRGYIINYGRRRYVFRIYKSDAYEERYINMLHENPELTIESHNIAPGQRIETYLPYGVFTGVAYDGSRVTGWGKIYVNPRIKKTIDNEKCYFSFSIDANYY